MVAACAGAEYAAAPIPSGCRVKPGGGAKPAAGAAAEALAWAAANAGELQRLRERFAALLG